MNLEASCKQSLQPLQPEQLEQQLLVSQSHRRHQWPICRQQVQSLATLGVQPEIGKASGFTTKSRRPRRGRSNPAATAATETQTEAAAQAPAAPAATPAEQAAPVTSPAATPAAPVAASPAATPAAPVAASPAAATPAAPAEGPTCSICLKGGTGRLVFTGHSMGGAFSAH